MNTNTLTCCLIAAAIGQLIIAILGPIILHSMNWKEPLARSPLLMREVFHVHTFFIALTCAIFGVITWRFAADIAQPSHELIRWFAAAIGIFWGIRCVMQWTVYSTSHWRGLFGRTVAHWTLFLGYGAFAITYLVTALRK
ncbi:MAG: hypothetical protein K1X78_06200 [Verrucomicrobiaceae bacterium]|nr:hypothetical protein [Verrucomicrobiaceae bacterium]